MSSSMPCRPSRDDRSPKWAKSFTPRSQRALAENDNVNLGGQAAVVDAGRVSGSLGERSRCFLPERVDSCGQPSPPRFSSLGESKELARRIKSPSTSRTWRHRPPRSISHFRRADVRALHRSRGEAPEWSNRPVAVMNHLEESAHVGVDHLNPGKICLHGECVQFHVGAKTQKFRHRTQHGFEPSL